MWELVWEFCVCVCVWGCSRLTYVTNRLPVKVRWTPPRFINMKINGPIIKLHNTLTGYYLSSVSVCVCVCVCVGRCHPHLWMFITSLRREKRDMERGKIKTERERGVNEDDCVLPADHVCLGYSRNDVWLINKPKATRKKVKWEHERREKRWHQEAEMESRVLPGPETETWVRLVPSTSHSWSTVTKTSTFVCYLVFSCQQGTQQS